ncbi:MAG: helix-turn-helix domain-containing protein, partial [Bacteroidetes bacterium]|nr:helix-turn-helix domain-containing protein [Bacteroidota bacterium]
LWYYITQLEKTERRLRNMSEMNVREKTADCLLMMINEFGLEKNKSTLNIKISRKDLASIAGISVDRLVKQLSEFEEEKIINASGQNINLLNKEKLQEVIAPYIDNNS